MYINFKKENFNVPLQKENKEKEVDMLDLTISLLFSSQIQCNSRKRDKKKNNISSKRPMTKEPNICFFCVSMHICMSMCVCLPKFLYTFKNRREARILNTIDMRENFAGKFFFTFNY